MAEADKASHLLIIKKKNLEDLLHNFNDIGHQMMQIAKEKRRYNRRLIKELIKKYKDQSAGGMHATGY